ncbi:hypothetical protein Lal_00031428 [Lupinus albus]|nr:hypothetical protein Lal_00031428 [Lupinus albus]
MEVGDSGGGVILNLQGKVTNEAKMKELLHRITSAEIKLCSDATKEFIRLLKGDNGGELLREYVRGSPKCSELLESLKLRQGKQGMFYIFELISCMLSHNEGKYRPNDVHSVFVSKDLDKFARLIIDEYLGDVYKELSSKEMKRQKAALLLMASVVRRGPGLAYEVSKTFDFKLAEFSKLAGFKPRWNDEKRSSGLLRKSFVGFAMSFLEVGKPGLLRWILQQRDMFSGVLRGLENDDDETVVFVLSTLRDRVLVEESLVPPGLRSVLFGSATLEQLVNICGREGGGLVAELAYNILITVCADPSNGLMPDLKKRPNPLRGNPKRIMGLMKKLWVAEVQYHRDLLLAIVNGRHSFGLSYLKEFPYNIENDTSSSWISAISVAAKLVSSVGDGLSKEFTSSQSNDPHSFDNMDLHNNMRCLFPRPFSRGLLHTNFLVKHGIVRLLLEILKLLDSLFGCLNRSSIKQEIQNYVQAFLPDPQVLLNLLSPLKARNSGLKRPACHLEHSVSSRQKLKKDTFESDIDIVVGGISSAPDIDLTGNSGIADIVVREGELDDEEDLMNTLGEIWGVDLHSMAFSTPKDAESYLHSKLLDALRYYRRTMPFTLDKSIESFMDLLKNPLELTSNLQVSLLSLLMEYVEWCPDNEIPIRTPPMFYKHLQTFIKLLMFSPVNGVRDQAYRLAMAAMFSTGYHRKESPINILDVKALQSLCSIVISFLCDAVSALGNNLVRYWDILMNRVHCLEGGKDLSPDFSPFIICVLEKCLQVIQPKSGTCLLPRKSMVLLYTCNTVKYLLQTQVDAKLLSAVVNADLTERLDGCYEDVEVLPEWKPLKNLLYYVESISCQQNCGLLSENEKSALLDGSLGSALGSVKRSLSCGAGHEVAETTIAFISSIISRATDERLTNLPSGVAIPQDLLTVPFSLLSSVFFLDHSVLVHASKLWPVMFYAGLDMALSDLGSDSRNAAPIGTPDLTLCPDSLTCNQLLHDSEADAAAFGIFLKQAPFHVLFPAMMCMNGPSISKISKIQELLLHKLSESTSDCSLLPNFQLVLFWIHRIQLWCKANPLAEIEEHLNLCVIIVGNLLPQMCVPDNGSDCTTNSAFHSSSHDIQQAIKTIFCHPSILMSLSFPLGSSQNFANGNIGNGFDMINIESSVGFNKLSNPILNILTMTLDYMWSLCGSHLCASEDQDVPNNFVKAFKGFQQKLFLDVRDRFELCICAKDMKPLHPTLYALHALVRFLSPFQLLELVGWMFSRVEVDDLLCKKSMLSVACSIAAGAFRTLSIYFQQLTGSRAPYDLFWEMGENNTKADIFEQIYCKVVDFSVNFEIDFADRCLLEAVNALYKQKHIQYETFHPLVLVMWKIIMVTPVEMLSQFIYKTNANKAKFLYILNEMSSLHSSLFGHLFLGIVNRSLHHDTGLMGQASDLTLSEDQFMLLLPTSLSYLSLISRRLGKQNCEDFNHLPYFYSKILFKGFSQWKSFLSKDIFEEEYGEFFPSSVQQLLCLFDDSLLGKSIHMVQYHFALNGDSVKMKMRLNLFKSICPISASQDELMDCDSGVIDSYSLHQSLSIIYRAVAKILLCKLLLFHEEAGGELEEVSMEMQKKLKASRLRFMNILVDIWQFSVKKFPLTSNQSGIGKITDISLLYNHLEVFVLKSILELTVETHNDLIQLQSIPFLEQLIRSALLDRFGDPTTMKTLRDIFTQLNDGRLSYDLHLQLLLAHSQFAPTLHSVRQPAGSFLKPISSILQCLVIPSLDHYENDEKHKEQTNELCRGPLEIIKLLEILLLTMARQTGLDSRNDIGINLKELHALLCHSYCATLSQIDLAIYNMMRYIESLCGLQSLDVTDLECFWGVDALKSKIEHPLKQNMSSKIKYDSEAIEEWSTSQHRDSIPIDPDICVSTVLYFPYDRSFSDELPFVNKIEQDIVGKKICSLVEVRERYDPVFILRFSIHSLSKAYIEPVEFAGSGLLAIAFVGMSSPDHGIRRLAYGTLDKFKNALEKCQKRKDVTGLRLLLNSVQNSIEEPFQRIPSVIALFAAEASCVLLDSSHDHYSAISTLLIHSSKLNMRAVPLFDNFFWSTSVNFKAERCWMLRLLYAGLNSDDDAMIYIRNSILENLMSFYVSPLSDVESKDLIIEVIKKSVNLHKIARHLVKHCSLFSWFSSLVSISKARLNGDENRFFLKHVSVVLKVVNDVISSGSLSKWLGNYGLEQLMDLSSNLFSFLLHDIKLLNESVGLVNPFLQMIASMLKLSQKRKIFQPHFTLSIEGIYQIYQAGSMCDQTMKSINPECALEAILMNSPPVSIFLMDVERLESFLIWAITTALHSDSSRRLRSNESHIFSTNTLREESHENSLVSKLLRWLAASIIIGKLYQKSNDFDSGFTETQNLDSLHSLLLQVENTSGQRHDSKIGFEKLLASTIFYLQQLLGINHEVLPSVVSALWLLVFGASNFAVGRTDLLQGYTTLISSSCSRIRCPPEANPSWRWTFYQPWKDHSLELTDSQKMEEYHACLTLLVIISNVLGEEKLETTRLSPLDVEKSGLFQWERSLLKN